MMWLVAYSYFLSAMIFYFYGNYHYVPAFDWFFRWLTYPILAIIIELPNMMVIYYIHWQTYKPKADRDDFDALQSDAPFKESQLDH